MKKVLIGTAALAALIGGGYYEGSKIYKEAEVKGCAKAVIYGLEQQYGDIPEEVKDKVLAQVETECRQIL